MTMPRESLEGFCRRHPLFAAALVAASSVAAAAWHPVAAALVAGAWTSAGLWISGWKRATAWGLTGVVAAGVLTVRTHRRDATEAALIASPASRLEAEILEDAAGSERSWSAVACLADGRRTATKILWQGRGELPVAGSRVRGHGSFAALPEPRNPGEFDQASWLRHRGVAAAFQTHAALTEVRTGPWARRGARIRQGFRALVTAGWPDDSQEAAVIRAVVIGERPPDADQLISAFRNSGTLHAFSVSGLHVAMVGSIGWCLLRLAGVPRRWAVLALLPLIFSYSWITGNSPPAVRSAWMAMVFLGAFVTRRRPDLLNALGAVLLVAMLWDGRLLFQPGVQLSYGVVAAIAAGAALAGRAFAWIARPELYLPLTLMGRRQRLWLKCRQWLANSLGVSLAAGAGSTPLSVYHFGLLTPVSVIAGVVLVPLVFVLLALALAAAAIGSVAPPAGRWVNRVNGAVADTAVFAAAEFAALPGGHFQLRQESEPYLLVYDLARGAGAACFAGRGNNSVLFDCGDAYRFKRLLVPSLRRQGLLPDSVVLSHPDGGHLGGGAVVWERFPIRQVLLPVERSRSPAFREWSTAAPAAGIAVRCAKSGGRLPLPDGAWLEVVHAPDPLAQSVPADDRVAIFRLHWRGWRVLFTSDAGATAELELLAAGTDVAADLIIAGHHRDDPGLCDAFVEAVSPRAIIASNASFPASERLDPRAVNYWRSVGIHVFDQRNTGAVTVRIDAAGNLELRGFVDGAAALLRR